METVLAFIAFWLLVAVCVIVQAAATALAIYFIIMFFIWLWSRADEKIRKRGNKE